MKCIKCGADTTIKETRVKGPFTTWRRHLCFDNHSFWTFEFPQKFFGRPYGISIEGKNIERKYRNMKRDRSIKLLKGKMLQKDIARKFNLSEGHVSRILKESK